MRTHVACLHYPNSTNTFTSNLANLMRPALQLASLGRVDIHSHEFHARPVPQYLSVPK